MVLDKQWMGISNRTDTRYVEGVDAFLDFAFKDLNANDQIRCPCNIYRNVVFKKRLEVRFHLFKHGILCTYRIWYCHGETKESLETKTADLNRVVTDDGMTDMLRDACGMMGMDIGPSEILVRDSNTEDGNEHVPNAQAAKFYKLLKDAQQELYPGCEGYSKLSFIVKLLHLKCLHHGSDAYIDDQLQMFRETLPNGHSLPSSYYEAKKYIADLGLDYVKIDACCNDCILYWGQHESAQQCPVCHSSRWKSTGGSKKIPHKVLRYFPIISRLQRLYMSSKTASFMRWHKEGRVKDGKLRHPADSLAWKTFDDKHSAFAIDARNVRLGLASDGFQPFGNMSSQYSIWPVVLIPYNLPPWMSMKETYFMLSLLIPGPKSPGMDIDVYLQPLIEDLKVLWGEGVDTYDAHIKQNFKLHAAVLWTISDFPAYAYLSGWSTKGFLACPCCHKDTAYLSLKSASKVCYMGHRRFLPKSHKWRKDHAAFDGTKETRQAPKQLSGDEVLKQFEHFQQCTFGKGTKRKYDSTNSLFNWRKKSIFFQLPYWKTLVLRHNLDVMHIEKNVCDNILGTLMNIKGKNKDTVKSRYDLVSMGIRQELHPLQDGATVRMPTTCYALSNQEKSVLCNMLVNLKTPDGYVSNISRCVNIKERSIHSMKSHDCHIFLQQLLPLAIRQLLPKEVCEPLIELSAFFRDLCSKTLDSNDLDHLQKQIIFTLCKLEMVFPPSFFDIMVHLTMHIPLEAKLAGPVTYRWMYPVERYLRRLKSYCRNKARPEGSIAAGYLADECLTFCSRYLDNIETIFNRGKRNYDDCDVFEQNDGLAIFAKMGRSISRPHLCHLPLMEFNQAHLYVLHNCDEVLPFINEHKEHLKAISSRNIDKRHNAEFSDWFYNRIKDLYTQVSMGGDLLNLAQPPLRLARRFDAFIVNGFRFHTRDREKNKKTQNSGVMVHGDNDSEDKEYYGVLTDIYELQYVGGNHVVLFKCDWWDVFHHGTGYRTDAYGFTSVNINKTLKTMEPFVLASQAKQVYYVQEPTDPNWLLVKKAPPRDLYSIPTTVDDHDADELVDVEIFQQDICDNSNYLEKALDDNIVITTLRRNDIIGQTIPCEVLEDLEKTLDGTTPNEEFMEDDDSTYNSNEEGEDGSKDDINVDSYMSD